MTQHEIIHKSCYPLLFWAWRNGRWCLWFQWSEHSLWALDFITFLLHRKEYRNSFVREATKTYLGFAKEFQCRTMVWKGRGIFLQNRFLLNLRWKKKLRRNKSEITNRRLINYCRCLRDFLSLNDNRWIAFDRSPRSSGFLDWLRSTHRDFL